MLFRARCTYEKDIVALLGIFPFLLSYALPAFRLILTLWEGICWLSDSATCFERPPELKAKKHKTGACKHTHTHTHRKRKEMVPRFSQRMCEGVFFLVLLNINASYSKHQSTCAEMCVGIVWTTACMWQSRPMMMWKGEKCYRQCCLWDKFRRTHGTVNESSLWKCSSFCPFNNF